MDLEHCKGCSYLEEDGFCILQGEESTEVKRCDFKEDYSTFKNQQYENEKE